MPFRPRLLWAFYEFRSIFHRIDYYTGPVVSMSWWEHGQVRLTYISEKLVFENLNKVGADERAGADIGGCAIALEVFADSVMEGVADEFMFCTTAGVHHC